MRPPQRGWRTKQRRQTLPKRDDEQIDDATCTQLFLWDKNRGPSYDDTESNLAYTNGYLVHFENPGASINQLGYINGVLQSIRDPFAYDIAASGIRANGDITVREITTFAQDGAGRVNQVELPTPSPDAPRPTRTYGYGAGYTDVMVAGLAMPTGYARRVTYDAALRQLTDVDATGKTASQVWDHKDRLVSTTDIRGSRSTTFYDHADRPVELYGPAIACAFVIGQMFRYAVDHETTTLSYVGAPLLTCLPWALYFRWRHDQSSPAP